MKIKYKLFLSSLVIVAVFLAAGLFINLNVTQMDKAQEDLLKAMSTDEASLDYLDGARALQVGVYISIQGNEEMGKQLMTEGTDKMAKSRTSLRKLLMDPVMLASLSDAEQLEETVIEAANNVINNIDNKALAEQNLNTLQGRVSALELKLKDIDEGAEKNRDIAVDSALTHSKITIQATYIGIIIALFVSLILSFIMASVMTKPIRALTDIANKVSKGDIQAKVAISSKDEIDELAGSFQRMINAFKIMDALNREK